MSESLEKLTFYMKSGNSFSVAGVMSWEVSEMGGKFSAIKLLQKTDRKRLIIATLDLGSVEAMTTEPVKDL